MPVTRGRGRHHTFPVPELLILLLIDTQHQSLVQQFHATSQKLKTTHHWRADHKNRRHQKADIHMTGTQAHTRPCTTADAPICLLDREELRKLEDYFGRYHIAGAGLGAGRAALWRSEIFGVFHWHTATYVYNIYYLRACSISESLLQFITWEKLQLWVYLRAEH